jgi:hypothetical protein
MAQNTTINLTAGVWTQITDADVSSLTFQNLSAGTILIKGTASASAPSTAAGSIHYGPGMGEAGVFLSELFPGVASAVRVYGYSDTGAAVFVSHA